MAAQLNMRRVCLHTAARIDKVKRSAAKPSHRATQAPTYSIVVLVLIVVVIVECTGPNTPAHPCKGTLFNYLTQ